MRFPLRNQLSLPCTFEQVIPGQLHPDGRRYLPLLVLRLDLPNQLAGLATSVTPPSFRMGIVDRHHVVDQTHAGQTGVAQLLLLLGTLRVQTPPYRQGLTPEPNLPQNRVSTVPFALGQVQAVPSWELERDQLPYEQLFTELLLDIGVGTLGVRTSATADDLAATLGTPAISNGDWIEVSRSRVDILGFSV